MLCYDEFEQLITGSRVESDLQLLVLYALGVHADPRTRVAFPGFGLLGEWTRRRGRGSVVEARDWLVDSGVVEVLPAAGRGRGRRVEHRLLLPVAQLTPADASGQLRLPYRRGEPPPERRKGPDSVRTESPIVPDPGPEVKRPLLKDPPVAPPAGGARPDHQLGLGGEVLEAWQRVLDRLRERVSEGTFAMWLAPREHDGFRAEGLRPVDIDRDGTLVLDIDPRRRRWAHDRFALVLDELATEAGIRVRWLQTLSVAEVRRPAPGARRRRRRRAAA